MVNSDDDAGLAIAAPSLPEFMDRHAGTWPGPAIDDLGPAGNELADRLGSYERATTLIHSAAWYGLLRTPEVAGQLDPSVDRPGVGNARSLVVGHADGTRLDLLVLSPSWDGPPRTFPATSPGPENSTYDFDAPISSRGRTSVPPIGRGYGMSLYAGGMFVPPRLIDSAVRDLVTRDDHELNVVIARTPHFVPTTTCTTPSLPVHARKRVPTADATVGLLYWSFDRTCVATTADHAIPKRVRFVRVGGVRAEVIARDAATDICVLRFAEPPPVGRARRINQVSVRPPRLNWPANFDGVTSGARTTQVRAVDPSVGIFGFPNPSHLYTDNDTAEGDSGAVLLDEDDEALGFAAYRTAYGQEPSMSVWMWAKQALLAVGLEGE